MSETTELDSWNNTFFVDDTYWDNRYNDGYTITNITESGESNNPTVVMQYDKGEIRTELATGLKYNHDNNQHWKWTKYSEKEQITAEMSIPTDSEKSSWTTWFEKNPDKVLGEVKQIKTKFNEPFTRVIGSVDQLANINVDFIDTELSNLPQLSVEKEPVNETTISESELNNLKQNLEKSKKVVAKTLIAQVNDKTNEIWSFEEIDKTYNAHLNKFEKQAYVVYLEKVLGKKVQGGFAKYSVGSSEQKLVELMRKGYLFYDLREKDKRRRYQPKFMFIAGNVYQKHNALMLDADYYIDKFGQEIYDVHKQTLDTVYKEKWGKAVRLDDVDVKKRLIIKPRSELAKSTYISSFYLKGQRFPVRKEGIQVFRTDPKEETTPKKIDLLKYPSQGRNQHYLTKFTLTEGFILWLKQGGSPSQARSRGIIYKNGMSVQQIHDIYIKGGNRPKDIEKPQWARMKEFARSNAQTLFNQFLEFGINAEDRRMIELKWNAQYNSEVELDVNKVPIGFRTAKRYNGQFEIDIRPEKRRAVAYNMINGSTMLAYGVGLGKTWCAIFTLAQNLELGFCKKPLIVVPNQVYPQFLKEIQAILPQYQINGLYNMRGIYQEQASSIAENSITIATYQALEVLGFSNVVAESDFKNRLQSILLSADQLANLSEKQRAKSTEKIDEILGKGKADTVLDFDSPNLNYDYLIVDEAHNFKKVFTQVRGRAKSVQNPDSTRISYEQTEYQISSGTPSDRALKLFFLTQYIQRNNPNGNIVLLTATPFTNSPLEVYSILALLNYDYLKLLGLSAMSDFYDQFSRVESDIVINTQLQPVRKQVFKGWLNVIGLQNILFKFIDKPTKEQEEVAVTRPNKIVLPLKSKMVDKKVLELPTANQVSTTLTLSAEQKSMWAVIKSYASGEISYQDLVQELNTTKCAKVVKKTKTPEGEEETEVLIDMSKTYDDPRMLGVRTLQCLIYARQLALNPYLYRFSGKTEEPTPQQYVESSPKMLYAVRLCASIKKHHEQTDTKISGTVVFMDIGTDCFPLVVSYITEKLNYQPHEVGYISGSISRIGNKKAKKDQVQDAFLGRIFDQKTLDFKDIPDQQRIKVLIGSSSIQEGMNLQFYSGTLINCYLPFNPTAIEQLNGRIWRQKNPFQNVRIVVPLMADSMDIFMFQKLEEKTQRINEIWARTGKNELDTVEFNPEELKYELITDLDVLAILESDDKKLLIDEDIDDVNYEINTLANIGASFDKLNNFYKDANNKERIFESGFLFFSQIANWYYFLKLMRRDLVTKPLLHPSYLEILKDLNKINRELQNSHLGEKILDKLDHAYSSGVKFVDFDGLYIDGDSVQLAENIKKAYKELPKLTRQEIDSGLIVPEGLFNYTLKSMINKMHTFVKDGAIYFGELLPLPEFEDISAYTKIKNSKSWKKSKGIVVAGTKDFLPLWETLMLHTPLDELFSELRLSRSWAKLYSENAYQRANDRIGNILKFYRGVQSDIKTGYTQWTTNIDSKIDFLEEINTYLFDKTFGVQIARHEIRKGSDKFWDLDYVLAEKKSQSASTVLKNMDLKLLDIPDKLNALNDKVEQLEKEKKNMDSDEYRTVLKQEIKSKREEELKDTMRQGGSINDRVTQFATSNPDYLGNKALDLVNEPKKKKVVSEPTTTPSRGEGIGKRIKGLQIALKVAKTPKDKASITKRIRGLELAKKLLAK